MKLVKNVMFFVFIIVIFASLWINIIIVTSQRTTQFDILDTINGIYFDDSQLSQEKIAKINDFINSNNSVTFSQLIQSNNPVKAFYGFCGFMKGNQKQAMKYLDDLVISTKKVDIYINNKQIKSILGYAVILLIKTFPENLTNPPIQDFYALSEKSISKAYKSQVVKMNDEYNDQIVKLITEKYPGITIQTTGTTTTTTISYDDIGSKTLDEKIKISLTLSQMSPDVKEKFILQLIETNNQKINLNILNSLNDKDTSLVAAGIFKMINTENNFEIIDLIIKKYALILKNNSIPAIQEYMKNNISNEKILLAGLEQLYNYGNENYYEFLKIFLDTRYSSDLNLMSLRTIIQTTYKTNPASVMKTLMFVIHYLNSVQLAYYSINFCMTNSITEGATTIILPRLAKKENPDMKKLAIDYIEHFNLKEGLNLVQELTTDENPDIQQKAKVLEEKLKAM